MTKLIGNEEAAKLLDVSVDTLRRICADGDLPVYKIRGQLKYKVEDIERYVTGQLRPVYRTVYAQRQPRTKAKSAGAGGCGYVPGMKVVLGATCLIRLSRSLPACFLAQSASYGSSA